MFISKSKYYKLMQSLQAFDSLEDDANYEAWDELDDEHQEVINRADRADDEWNIRDFWIEWDKSIGRDDQVSLVVMRSLDKSSLVDESGRDALESELAKALDEWARLWAEKELEMMGKRIKNKKKDLTEKTLLSEREAEAYILTEELGYLVQEAAEEMNVSVGRVKNIRHRIREKLEKSRETIDQIKI